MKTVCWRWILLRRTHLGPAVRSPVSDHEQSLRHPVQPPFARCNPRILRRAARGRPRRTRLPQRALVPLRFSRSFFGRFAENGSLENESGPQGRSQRPARSRPRDSYLRDGVGVRAPLDRRDRGQLPQATCRTLSAPASDRRRDRRPLRRSAGRPARRKASDPHVSPVRHLGDVCPTTF